MSEGTGEVFLTQIEAKGFANRGAKNREAGYGKNHGFSYGLAGGGVAHLALRTTASGSVFGLTEGGSAVVIVKPVSDGSGVVAPVGSGEAVITVSAESTADYIIQADVEAVIAVTAEATGETEAPVVAGDGVVEIALSAEASGELALVGDGAVEIALSAEASGEVEIIVVPSRPAYRDPWVSIGFYSEIGPVRPVAAVGKGEARLSVRASATGSIGSVGAGTVTIRVEATAEGECDPGHFGEDNAFFMLAA